MYKKKGDLKRTRIDEKTGFSVVKGIISQSTKKRLDELYDKRNNVHILKAVSQEYYPKRKEAEEAYNLMKDLVSEVRFFYSRKKEKEEGDNGEKVL